MCGRRSDWRARPESNTGRVRACTLATVTRAVSTPRISVSRDAQGVTVGALVRATAYDVQLVSGEILTAVGPADLERDAKRAAIDYLKHEHTPERTRPARRSAE